ncbi:MAG: DUF2796 domain-containing protein [Vibrio anguillarum]|uniref:zinc uptake protein ZrgA n=1 Tax=Vibrio anguillarum TaxID=55601 RepID=UPI00097E274A|nr:DUF2796 domain-containing protein [Vibrio anguillarum]MBT2948700.1 DUF2796 domain-containing protein [Vibrio anguillarum]MDT3847058.1 DUF2796 domain-containing protein [Vibrio anguillarum]
MFIQRKLALSIGLILSMPALANEEFRQHEAHVHGHVEFNIAQDGQDLLIEITAPGADVVGFEHAPQNDEQQQRLNKVLEQFSHADGIFQLPAPAKCHLEESRIAHTLNGEHHDHDHDHDHHEKHDDKHQDKDAQHAHHDHKKDVHDEGEHSGHGEFTIQYQYHCDNMPQLQYLDTQWFNLFPNTQTISANVLTDKAQSASELKTNSTRITF